MNTKKQTIIHITNILKRMKYQDDFAGDYPFDPEEYAEQIYNEVIKSKPKKKFINYMGTNL